MSKDEMGSKEELKPKVFKILVAEDDSSNADVIKDTLSPVPDIELRFVVTGEDALEELRKGKKSGRAFDLVMTNDMLAGKMRGLDLATVIKNESLCPHVTLLAGLAATIGKENSPDQLREKGIRDLIAKPFDVNELKSYVEGLKNNAAQDARV